MNVWRVSPIFFMKIKSALFDRSKVKDFGA